MSSQHPILVLRNSIVVGLRDAMPVREVVAAGGRLNVEDLRRLGARTPCIAVAALGAPAFNERSTIKECDLRWVAYLITKDVPGSSRDAQALAFLAPLFAAIASNSWGEGQRPTELTADNLYTRQIDELGLALWAVTWRQRIEVAPFDHTKLDKFLELVAQYDLAPLDGVIEAESKTILEGPQ